MSSKSKAFVGFILAVGILAVSTAAIFVRLAIAAASDSSVGFSLTIAASRLIVATLILLPGWRSVELTKINRRSLAYAIAAGIFLSLHFACWITSLAFTSIAASTTLVTTNPVWVTLICWGWQKQRPSIKTIFGIIIAISGSIVVAFSQSDPAMAGSKPLFGNGLALFGAVTVSCYMICGKQAQQNLSMTNYIAIAYSTAALILFPLPLLWGYGYIGYSTPVYVYIILLAIAPQLIGHSSINWSLRWLDPTTVTLAILFEPIVSSFLGILVFAEIPSSRIFIGGSMILAGVATALIGKKPNHTSH